MEHETQGMVWANLAPFEARVTKGGLSSQQGCELKDSMYFWSYRVELEQPFQVLSKMRKQNGERREEERV